MSSSANRRDDPLTPFCEELNPPVEEITNLLYLTAHAMNSAPDHAKDYLTTAQERLEEVHRTILSHCESYPLEEAS